MSETTDITCARHPETPTRLFCSECGTPVCPRCLIETAVGQKCPECARQKKAAVRRGKPHQYRKGIAAGVGAAVLAAVVLSLVYRTGGFFRAIITGFVAYGVAKAVLWGAENNRADPFRNVTMALAVVATVVAWLLTPYVNSVAGLFHIGPIFTYVGAVYGVWIAYNR